MVQQTKQLIVAMMTMEVAVYLQGVVSSVVAASAAVSTARDSLEVLDVLIVLVVAFSLVVTVVADSGAGAGALAEVARGVVVELRVVKDTVALELSEVVCGVVVELAVAEELAE
eukprot:1405095-Pyramimonas_sp.AAC.1